MPELFDALDKDGQPTGFKKTKDQILADGDWRRVVHVWVVNDRGELLVQQRARGRRMWDGLWDVSMGGSISAGELPEPAAVRELEEELGLVVSQDELEYLGQWNTSKPIPERNQMSNEFSDTFLLRHEVDVMGLHLAAREVAATKLISLNDLERQVTTDKYQQWVPHGAEYYLGVIALIRERMAAS